MIRDGGGGGLKDGDQGVKGVASMIGCFRILMISEICFDAKTTIKSPYRNE